MVPVFPPQRCAVWWCECLGLQDGAELFILVRAVLCAQLVEVWGV